jgi:shikimate dehydrogenase
LASEVYNNPVSERFNQPINASTRICAVYGWPVKHSASPAMQNAGIAALGLDWCYLAYEVHPDNLRSAIEGAQAMNFIGLNLTVPHKLLAVEMVDVIDESAKSYGAVNTIRFEGKDQNGDWKPLGELLDRGDKMASSPLPSPPTPIKSGQASEKENLRLGLVKRERASRSAAPNKDAARELRSHGFNTDAEAITRALQEDLGLKLSGAKVLLLGAGGAGRTAALKLASENVAELFLVNRTVKKAEAVAEEIRKRQRKVKVAVGYPKSKVDLVLNATSLGLRHRDPLPFEKDKFSLNHTGAVYDMIYRPAETPLLKEARTAGCRTANGLGMLLYQGAKALELWSGRPAPIEVMRKALEEEVYGPDH